MNWWGKRFHTHSSRYVQKLIPDQHWFKTTVKRLHSEIYIYIIYFLFNFFLKTHMWKKPAKSTYRFFLTQLLVKYIFNFFHKFWHIHIYIYIYIYMSEFMKKIELQWLWYMEGNFGGKKLKKQKNIKYWPKGFSLWPNFKGLTPLVSTFVSFCKVF